MRESINNLGCLNMIYLSVNINKSNIEKNKINIALEDIYFETLKNKNKIFFMKWKE